MYLKNALLTIILLVNFTFARAQNNSPFSGIWIYHAADLGRPETGCTKLFDKKSYNYPGLKGVMLDLAWKKIQPTSPLDTASQWFGQGGFNWNFLDSELIDLTAHGLYIGLLIWTGEDAPDWLYTAPYNIGSCNTNGENACQDIVPKKFPDYYNPAYQLLWRNMTDSLLKHLDAGPDSDGDDGNPIDYRNNIVFYQSCQGATGDLDPQKGALVTGSPPYCFIDKANWFNNIVKPSWLFTDTAVRKYKTNLPYIHLLVNNDDANCFTSRELDSGVVFESQSAFTEQGLLFRFATDSLQNAWRKGSGSGHFYQLNYESYFRNAYTGLNPGTVPVNDPVLLRDECDLHNINIPGATNSYNFFAIAGNALYSGIDMWMISYDLLYANDSIADPADTSTLDDYIDPANLWITRFFNNNSNRNPLTASHAFCALRDGLDAGNFSRFPAADFNSNDSCNATAIYKKPKRSLANNDSLNLNCGSQRAINIQQSKAGYGALQLDAPAAQGKPIHQRNLAIGTNDVGWYINAGNYERFLYQMNIVNNSTAADSSNSTSAGYWNKIYPDTNTADTNYNNQVFGRFARGFDVANNKNNLFFNIDDSFISTQPVCNLSGSGVKAYAGRINITYLDSGYGKWTLLYDGINNTGVPVIQKFKPVSCTNTLQWITRSFVIPCNARFANGGTKGSDFFIHNSGIENVVFSLVEFEKLFSRPVAAAGMAMRQQDRLLVSPNPVEHIFRVNAQSKALIRQLYIYRQDGLPVFSLPVNNYSATINRSLANLHTGIYYIKALMQDNSFITGKIIVP